MHRIVMSAIPRANNGIYFNVCKKGKISSVTGPEWSRGFQEVKVPRFRDKNTGLTHQPPLPPQEMLLILISVRG